MSKWVPVLFRNYDKRIEKKEIAQDIRNYKGDTVDQ